MAEKPEIATIGDCITYLGIGSTISDADRMLLRMCKSAVENQARNYCRHNITQPASEYVHILPFSHKEDVDNDLADVQGDKVYFYGRSQHAQILQLPQPFLRSVTSLFEDFDAKAGASGDFAAATELTEDTDFYGDWDESGLSRSGHLIKQAGGWSTEPRTIKVTYNAGFTAAELDGEYLDIKWAIMEETAMRFNAAKSRQGSDGAPGPIKSERIGRYAVTYDTRQVQTMSLSESTMERLNPYVAFGVIA